MQELAILVVVVIAIMLMTTIAVRLVGPVMRVLEQILLVGSVVVILFVMLFVGAEVLMRYGFNAPIPGHLEGSELLVPVIVFLALSYTQATHGHVGMDLLLDALSVGTRRWARIGSLLASIFVCAVVTWFSFKHTYQLWEYDDVTMTPPYFRTWPASAAIPLGYMMCAIRMFIQVLNLLDPKKFADYAPQLPKAEHLSGPD